MANTVRLLLSVALTVGTPIIVAAQEQSPPATPSQPTPQTLQPLKEVTSDDTESDLIEPEQPAEDVDIETAEEETDSVVPKTEQNPFNKPDIDGLIGQQFNDDMWRIMRGGLPCLETSAFCLQQLQERAVSQSPLLKEIDTKIEEINQRIEEAKAKNQTSIKLSIFEPALQVLLRQETVTDSNTKTSRTIGIVERIGRLFTSPAPILNELLSAIGIPLLRGRSGGNDTQRQAAIAISDLQIKVAQMQRDRAEVANLMREKVAVSLVKFDEARTDFQISQVVSVRAVQQFQVFELRYVRGNSDTETYLARQNQLDSIKAQTYSSWAKMRRTLFELKLLVLSVKDAEI